MEIKLLTEETISRIAAGEVIERPLNVVKELVENSIDAGATAITVEIKDGGIGMVRVTDNGCGIEKAQIAKAFIRHATSKIQDADDLSHLSSLGFRGEALASIAAVAQVEMITKTKESILGTRAVNDHLAAYSPDAPVKIDLEEIGAPDGTTVIVRSLFGSIPVRRRFLRQPQTEAGYITDLIEKQALSHPDVSFHYRVNGQEKLHTTGNGDLKELIYRIYGRETAAAVLPVHAQDMEHGLRLDGFLGRPEISRSSRSFETFFINGRMLRSKELSAGLEEGYRTDLMQHRFPFAVLHLSMPPEDVDVNVHPSKMEVRFTDRKAVMSFIDTSVHEALRSVELIPKASLNTAKEERAARKKEAQLKAARLQAEPRPEAFESDRLAHRAQNSAAQGQNGSGGFFESNLIARQAQNPAAQGQNGSGGFFESNRFPGIKPAAAPEKASTEISATDVTSEITTDTSISKAAAFVSEKPEVQGAVLETEVTKTVDSNTDLTETHATEGAKKSPLPSFTNHPSNDVESFFIDKRQEKKSRESLLPPFPAVSVGEQLSLSDLVREEDFSKKYSASHGVQSDVSFGKSNFSEGVSSVSDRESAVSEWESGVSDRQSAVLNELSTVKKDRGCKDKLRNDSETRIPDEEPLLTKKKAELFRFVGQVFNTYWIIEVEKRLLIIDQHAAHEKVNYERMMRRIERTHPGLDSEGKVRDALPGEYLALDRIFKDNLADEDGSSDAAQSKPVSEGESGDAAQNGKEQGREKAAPVLIASQRLLPPLVLRLSGREEAAYQQYAFVFAAMGYEIEEFGGGSYAIRAVPTELFGQSADSLLREILEEIISERISGTPRAVISKVASMSCKAAVKGNARLSEAEARALIRELLTLENPFHCPHGRPTMIIMSQYEMDRKFRRIV